MFFLPPGTTTVYTVYHDCDKNEALPENNITFDTFMSSPQLEITEREAQSETAPGCGTIGSDSRHREYSHETHSSC
jgi:hypothetical protein